MAKDPLLSFWLIPTKEDRATLQTMIHQLAEQYGSVGFYPHVTLVTIPVTTVLSHLSIQDPLNDISPNTWTTYLTPSITNIKPLSLKIQGVHSSHEFAKTVFCRLEKTQTLLKVIKYLQQAMGQDSDPDLIDPHVSLIYQSLEPQTKEAIARSIYVPQHTFHFDEIQIIEAPPQFETLADVKQLRCLHSQLLIHA